MSVIRGIVNLRDLGGNSALGGRTVRSGMLLRAAHLADATEADLAYLSQLHISTVIDFRLEEDSKGKQDREVPGAVRISLPIDASGDARAQATEEERRKLTRRKKFDVKSIIVMLAFNKKAQAAARDMYPTLLFHPQCQRQFAEFFRIVLRTQEGGILYHCTQGKDRTGIASALLLAALGADRQTIVADFDKTNRAYVADVRKYSRRVRFLGGKEEEVAVVKSFLGANTDNFVAALDEVERRFGSLEAYLKGPLGLTESDLGTLRERFLSV